MQSEVLDRYTRTAIIFHWVIAVLVIGNILLAWTFKTVPDDIAQPFTNAHKTIGITVLGLALMRLLWRFGHRPPPFSPAIPRWQVVAARTGHAALYFIVLAMPLSGWIYDSAWEWAAAVPISVFGLFEMPRIGWVVDMPAEPKKVLDEWSGDVHVALSYVLYVVLAAHLTGAAKHQWFDRVPIMRRMMFHGVGKK
ncbi:MAG: cytochrome b [Steroidobacterales bacterium]